MKKLILCAAIGWLAFQASAVEWLTDVPKAIMQAKTENKVVLMDFTGSDWCPPCKQLHKRVLTSKEFETYAAKNLVLVVVDFPEKKPQTDAVIKANKALAEQYSVNGFPTIILVDGSGKVLSKDEHTYDDTPKQFIDKIEKLKSKPVS